VGFLTPPLEGEHVFTYSYHWAESTLAGRSRRKLTHNTYLVRRSDDTIAVLLHETDIVTFQRSGDVMLDSGGWLTPVTKDRMNRYCDAMVGSTKGVWHVTWGSTDHGFADGMVLHPDGSVSGGGDLRAAAKANAERNAAIATFVGGITPERIVKAFTNMGGDCLYCQWETTTDCAATHVEEDYFHGHLAYRAIKAKGFPNPDLIMSVVLSEARRGHVDRLLTDSLRRYLRNALTKAAVSA